MSSLIPNAHIPVVQMLAKHIAVKIFYLLISVWR